MTPSKPGLQMTLGAGLLAALALAGACGKDRPEGSLPPADDWKPPSEIGAPTVAQPPAKTGGDPHAGMGAGDPHAGMGAANPHAGMGMGGAGGDPHAGMGMGGAGGDPHAGMGMGGMEGAAGHATQGEAAGPPVLAGSIRVADGVAQAVGQAPLVFLSVRQADPVTGQPVGPPLATHKLDAASFPAPFSLNGPIDGDVVVTAWTDNDRDAISRRPGDVVGSKRVKAPALTLDLVLDTVVE
jgi:hypothetical protein